MFLITCIFHGFSWFSMYFHGFSLISIGFETFSKPKPLDIWQKVTNFHEMTQLWQAVSPSSGGLFELPDMFFISESRDLAIGRDLIPRESPDALYGAIDAPEIEYPKCLRIYPKFLNKYVPKVTQLFNPCLKVFSGPSPNPLDKTPNGICVRSRCRCQSVKKTDTPSQLGSWHST